MFYRKHKRVTLDCGDQMITKQSHKDECDIHRILKQYQRTGIITHVQQARGTYEDLPSNTDFQEALNTMMSAEQAFAGLPAQVRRHFDNDPARFLAAFSDRSQHDQLREFGLLKPKAAPAAPDAAPEPPAT